LTTSIRLESLEDELKKKPKEINEWFIIADLMAMINYLLGYDWDGIINRHVIFFQDKDQEHINSKKSGKIQPNRDYVWILPNLRNHQRKIAMELKNQGLNIFKISMVLNLSESMVWKLLK